MTGRERVLASLAGKPVDRVPRLLYGEAIGYVPKIKQLLMSKCHPHEPRAFFQMDITGVTPGPTRLPVDRFQAYWAREPEALTSGQVDEWGVWWRQGDFHHFAHIEPSLTGTLTLQSLRDYPWPDLDEDYRYKELAAAVCRLQQEGYAVCAYAGSIFEQAWYLRGMNELMMDMLSDPPLAEGLLDRTAYFQRESAIRLCRSGIDILITGDDVAMQHGLMMSIDLWRQYLKPRLAATIKAARQANPAIKVFYHSDGNVEALIPELVEIGVDILNPIQPECMDPARIKRLYGDRLAFWGTVSVQQTMPFGTPQQVREEVMQRVATVGLGGGFILAPAHVLSPETPWENIVAFFEAANEAVPPAS